MDVLEKYYENNQDWSNELIEEIANKTELLSKQVSKWLWDQKTKNKISKKSKKNKKLKTEEYEPYFDKVKPRAVNPSSSKPKTKQNKRQLDTKIDVKHFSDRNSDLKEKESFQTFSHLDSKLSNRIPRDEILKEKTMKNSNFEEKNDIESEMGLKISNKSFGFRERFSKIAKNK